MISKMFLRHLTLLFVAVVPFAVCFQFRRNYCDLRTRFETFSSPAFCSHSCNTDPITSKFEGCGIDALCFLKTVVGMVTPARYRHALYLGDVYDVSNVEERVRNAAYAIDVEKRKLDELVDWLGLTDDHFMEEFYPNDPSKNSRLSYVGMWDVTENGYFVPNVTCYYEIKLEQRRLRKMDEVLKLSGIRDHTDHVSIMKMLLDQVIHEKILLETLQDYLINAYDIMVDIYFANNRESLLFLEKYYCGGGVGLLAALDMAVQSGGIFTVPGNCGGECMVQGPIECHLDHKCYVREKGYQKS